MDNTFGESTNVYRVGNKIFAMVNVEGDQFVTIKHIPDDGKALRAAVSWARPGYYMNKQHWSTVDFGPDVPRDDLEELIAESYRLVFTSLTKKARAAITDSSA